MGPLGLAAAVALALSLLSVGNAGAAAGGESERVLREGEKLVFDVTWMGIKAGQATLEARGVVQLSGQQAYHLVTTAQSAPFISKFYRVDDRSDSYLAWGPLRSLQFDKQLREGGYRHNSQTAFDHEAKVAAFRYLDFGPVPKGVTKLEEAVLPCGVSAGLDPVTAAEIDALLVALRDRSQTTLLVVTHNIPSARAIGHELIFLDQGRIIAQGTPAALEASENPLVRQFMSSEGGG